MARLERIWRICATAVCFATFGLGGLLLAFSVIPLLWLLPKQQWRVAAAQHLVSAAFRMFLSVVELFGVGRVSVEGDAELRSPGARLVMANHPTLLDVVVLISRMPQADCVVKEGVRTNPFMRAIVRTTGYISNASPDGFIEECVASLRQGRKLIIFPEGTRSTPGKGMCFQRGAARIALASAAPLQIVTITCDPPTLMKGEKWYEVPERRWHIDAKVHPAQTVDIPQEPSVPEPAAARRFTARLKEQFEWKLAGHDTISE